jgi:hypothetical protein
MKSRGGICRERPRAGKRGRRGVVGVSLIALSSFVVFFAGSRNLGDGDSVGGPQSERLRAFGDRGGSLAPSTVVGLTLSSAEFSVLPVNSSLSLK